MQSEKFYVQGEYILHNPTLHEEDSPWKAHKIRPFVDIFLKQQKQKTVSLLDVGGGAGKILAAVTEQLENAGRKVQQHSLDLSPDMLRVQQKNNPKAKIVCGDIKKTPFADKQFDLVLMIDVIEHVPQPKIALKELQRIARYVIFKVPLENNLLDCFHNLITAGKYRARVRKTIGHINIYNYKKLKRQVENNCGKIIAKRYTNAHHYYLTSPNYHNRFRRRAVLLLSRAVYGISPSLSAKLFPDFVIALAKCHDVHREYSTKEHWESFWTGIEPSKSFKPHYHRLVRNILPHNNKWTAFEIGCVPGNYLMYFYTNYGYKPAGIDYSDRTEKVKDYFAKQGIPAEIYNQDFFTFKPRKKYNLVLSNGFVEHFGNPEQVFKKHFDLLDKGGYLIVSLPNFRNLQYYLHSIFDSRTLKTHNFDVMTPALWRNLAEKYKLRIHYCNYYETFNFWVVNKSLVLRPMFKIVELANRMVHFILKRTGLVNIPNKQLSPNIVLVAQK